MFLKLKVSCNCRCSYYLNEAISADKISCPNCGKEHPYSKEILDLYHTYNDEFLALLSKEPVKVGKATATKYPSAK